MKNRNLSVIVLALFSMVAYGQPKIHINLPSLKFGTIRHKNPEEGKKISRKPDWLPGSKIEVVIPHPPEIPLDTQRIAIIADDNADAEEFAAEVISYFVNNSNVEIMTRENLSLIMEEHNLGMSDLVDPDTVPKLGKILGLTAIQFVKVHRLAHEDTKSSNRHEEYTSFSVKRTLNLKVSVQALDLTSGRIFGSQFSEVTVEESTSSNDGYPNPPSLMGLRSKAFKEAVGRVLKYYLPWEETRRIRFFTEKKHFMREAFHAYQVEELEEAITITREGIEDAEAQRAKPKVLSKLYHNMGALLIVKKQYTEAGEFFKKANRLSPEVYYRQAQLTAKEAAEVEDAFNSYQNEERARSAKNVPEGAPLPTRGSANTDPEDDEFMRQLTVLQQMFEKGLITRDDYDREKKAVIDKMKGE